MTVANRNKKRVLLIITSMNRGGAQAQFVRLATGLERSGVETRLLCLYTHPSVSVDQDLAPLPIESLGLSRVWHIPRAFWKAYRIVREFQPRTLISFLFHATLFSRLLKVICRVPIEISSFRNERYGGRLRDLLLSWTDCCSNLAVVNTQRARQKLIERSVISADKSVAIPNMYSSALVPLDELKRIKIRSSLHLKESDFVWIAVGRLEPAKNYPNLIAAFSKIKRAKLLIVGPGSLEASLGIQIREAGLQDQIRLLGLRDDVFDLLQASDAYVLSSDWEGMPNALMEAMAAGLPSVATDVGGVSELLSSSDFGLVVPPGDPHALAAAMQNIVDSPVELRESMGRLAQKYIMQNFEPERVMQLWMRALNEVDRAKV